MKPDWFPDWSGQTCALIGSGPSVSQEAVAKFCGRVRVLAVNTSYQLAPWADCLYACDGRWWAWHKGVPGFTGLKVTQDVEAAKLYKLNLVHLLPMRHPEAYRVSVQNLGHIGCRGHSGGHALNLLVQFGCRRILAMGLDFCGERWHGAHPVGKPTHKPASFERWRKSFDAQAPLLATLGVDLINISPISTLTAYPRMSIEAALAQETVRV